MNIIIRRKLEMAARVRDFTRAHPDANAGYAAAAARLEDRVTRAEVLAQQEVAGRRTVSGAVINKEQLRTEIYHTVGLLAGLARPASREEPDLLPGIARPPINASNQGFLTSARVAAVTANAHRGLLLRYGMPDAFLDDLGRMLDRFEGALNEKHAGQAAHVGAGADLRAVTAEIMAIAQQLDALNRFRFRDDPEALGAWRSARNVAWPMNDKAAGALGEGTVRPAA
jgi:hypothetical protein